jgi:hypothetical protein
MFFKIYPKQVFMSIDSSWTNKNYNQIFTKTLPAKPRANFSHPKPLEIFFNNKEDEPGSLLLPSENM